MKDGQGDSYTQSFAFGSPEPESDVPDVPGDVVYQTTSGDQCENGQEGGQVTLNQGQSATTQAWIVLQDAITPAYPNGASAQLGVNFVFLGYAGSSGVTSAQGNAVCAGDSQTQQEFSPPYLVFAGNAPSGEGCDGSYTTSPN